MPPNSVPSIRCCCSSLKPVHAELHPGGHLRHHVEGLPVAAQQVDVEEAGHDLVQRVVGRPDALPGLDAVDQLFREGRQVPGVESLASERRLHLRQLRHHHVRAFLEPDVARARVHQRERRKVVADTVAAEFNIGRLPAAERCGGGRQAGGDSEVVKEPALVQRQQVLLVPQHRLAERPVEQAHVLQVEVLHLARHGRCHGGRRRLCLGGRLGCETDGGDHGGSGDDDGGGELLHDGSSS